MRIIKSPITRQELEQIAKEGFGNLIKAVVDMGTNTMAIGGDLHSDEEALLLEKGSKQQNLWGINLYPEVNGEDWIEFDSIINIRPSQNNLSRGVDNPEIREKIIKLVTVLVKK